MNDYADPQWVAGFTAALTEVGGELNRRITELEQAELVEGVDRFAHVHELRMIAAHCSGTLKGLTAGLARIAKIEDTAA